MAQKNQQFSERLSAALKVAKVSQKQLAEDVSVETVTINRYVKQGRVPEWDILLKIAERLSVSCDWLLKGEEDSSKHLVLMGGQDYINLPDGKELSEPERATLGQALEVLRATGDIEGGYAKALYQSIQMLHQGLRATRVVDQSPAARAAEAGGSRAGRKKRSSADS